MFQSGHSSPTPEQLVADLVLLLDLQPHGGDRFTGHRRKHGLGRVFGGQVIAQALGAARRTVEDKRAVHSLHAYFLRPGTEDQEIEFRVKRDFDGRSFSNRRVVASQAGQPILNLTASFQQPQDGLSHQSPSMPDVPPPEDIESDAVIRRQLAPQVDGQMRDVLLRARPIDFRSVETRDWLEPVKREALSHVWFRTVGSLPDHDAIHRAVLAYASDFQLLSTSLMPHGLSFHRGEIKAASLDHAIWFHDSFRADEWLLYVTDSPSAGSARTFNRGQIFSRDGRLVASVAQEGMVREARSQS
ncbi:acyl-CoA thioesterase [Altericroceibacterium endophyticum]|uniref:Acyl-CoA thioesterase 2 n=1 Tax=Altericroceibacterium endophyticum TaxID=1808508 RepID=A0A6I4T3R2_9SPHN|nr:acyl-CoA thioesterase II [Altericroceibacterium endophyticum]MXO64175.1 acyl-CoA thioesterase II [Altericroceibacterium endophyticum]